MEGYYELLEKLKEIKDLGYVDTHRSGNTGIGKTLEDLLGIVENNIPGPNAAKIELKSARKNASSMLTLFTKAPSPYGANSILLTKFGYPSRTTGERVLHTTVNAVSYNTINGNRGFIIRIEGERVELVTDRSVRTGLSLFLDEEQPDGFIEILGYWDKSTLRTSFERKLPKLLYVKADCMVSGDKEKFWYNEAWLLSGFSFENFLELLVNGNIKVDIRIGQYPDGRPHDRGTGFRVSPDKLDLCFSHRESVL